MSGASARLSRMRESDDELRDLQALLDRSHATASEHLRDIISADRTLTARELAGLMTGMRVVSFATVTAAGEPRISAMDGHFLHGRWTISTSRSSPKGRQVRARPAVSLACIEGEEVAVFTHGQVEVLEEGHSDFEEVHEHWTQHYGSSPLSWGDVILMRVEPTWMVGYAAHRDALLATRGVAADPSRR